jgi:hypothetical protein
MDPIMYRGYEIRPVPNQVVDSEEWTINVVILKHGIDQVHTRQFSASNSFKLKDEAVKHCILFAQQIIDVKAENCTVEDL